MIITGHGDIDNAIEALQFGASDFVNKPIRDEALAIALKRAHERLDIRRKLKDYTATLEREVARATLELRRKSGFLAKVIRSANDGIVATDSNFRIVTFNPGAERIFGFTRAEVIEKASVFDLYPPEIADYFSAAGTAAGVSGELPWKEVRIASRGGTLIPVRFAGTLLHEKGQVMGSVAFFQDLTRIKALEKELVHSERLAAVGQTVAGLAHGIKNILHGFKGGSYLVNIGIERNDREKLATGWEMISRNIARTSDLVLDLLSYSKEREPEYEVCRPNGIAAEVCDLLEVTARENRVAIQRDFDPRVGEAVMDPRTIHSCLLNLASNAIDACIFDGAIGKDWKVRLETRLEGPRTLRFSIVDNGVGMRPEVREKLFTSFFSTKGHRGTGLGLLVTRKLVTEHGGDIDVTSEEGKGTTFVIRLPFEPAGAPWEEGPPEAGAGRPGRPAA